MRVPIFNVSRRKVGGIWFIKVGRFNVSFSVSRRDCERGSCRDEQRRPTRRTRRRIHRGVDINAVDWLAVADRVERAAANRTAAHYAELADRAAALRASIPTPNHRR